MDEFIAIHARVRDENMDRVPENVEPLKVPSLETCNPCVAKSH
jgi:hypothetical protein